MPAPKPAPAPSGALARFSKLARGSLGLAPSKTARDFYVDLANAARAGDLVAFEAALPLLPPPTPSIPEEDERLYLPLYYACRAPANGSAMVDRLYTWGKAADPVGGPDFCPMSAAVSDEKWDTAKNLARRVMLSTRAGQAPPEWRRDLLACLTGAARVATNSSRERYRHEVEDFFSEALSALTGEARIPLHSRELQRLCEPLFPGGVSGLYVACGACREAVNAFLGLAYGANATDPTTGETVLHRAASRNSLSTMRALLDYRANLYAENREGQTPLQLAWASSPRDGDPGSGLCPQNDSHAKELAETLELFLAAGAPLQVSPHTPETWADRAVAELNPFALKVALDAGADPASLRPDTLHALIRFPEPHEAARGYDKRALDCLKVISQAKQRLSAAPIAPEPTAPSPSLPIAERLASSRRIAIKPKAQPNAKPA